MIVLGAVGICLDIVDCIRFAGRKSGLTPYGFLDDDPSLMSRTVQGLPVLGRLEMASSFADAVFVCGIGSPKSFRSREALIARTGVDRSRFANVIHTMAQVSSSAQLGCGVVVLANCSVGAGAVLEDHVLMLPNCVVGHDTSVGQRSMLAGGVVLSGNVRVGADCYLGAGASVREELTIGRGSLLGLGSALVSSMPAGTVFFGNPAQRRDTV